MKEFLKKVRFFLVVSKIYCTFAPANEEKTFLSGVVIGWRFYTRSAFWCHSSVGRASD